MAITIQRLVCNVTVRARDKKSPLNKDPKSQQPDLLFRAPASMNQGQSGAAGGETATEDKGPATGKSETSASSVDPHKVAEKVYQLMKDEIKNSRLRGGSATP